MKNGQKTGKLEGRRSWKKNSLISQEAYLVFGLWMYTRGVHTQHLWTCVCAVVGAEVDKGNLDVREMSDKGPCWLGFVTAYFRGNWRS